MKISNLARQAALLTKRECRILFEPGSEARMALVLLPWSFILFEQGSEARMVPVKLPWQLPSPLILFEQPEARMALV